MIISVFPYIENESVRRLTGDVLSELDAGRQDFVLNQIVSGQVFITCCEPGRFTKLGKTMEIKSGKLVDSE